MAENEDRPFRWYDATIEGSDGAVLEVSVGDLDIGTRGRNVLANLGCRTVRDVLAYAETEFLRQPNFGRGSLSELRNALLKVGVSFTPPTRPVDRISERVKLLRAEANLRKSEVFHRRHLKRVKAEIKKIERSIADHREKYGDLKTEGVAEDNFRASSAQPHAGDILPDGSIVGAGRIPRLISSGEVWISMDKLEDAESAGWKSTGEKNQDGSLVIVERRQ